MESPVFSLLSAARLSLRGIIYAGWPSPAEEELGDSLPLDEWLVPRREASFLVRIGTDALRKRGILAGDIAIMEKGISPKRGDVIIAQTDDGTVIREYVPPVGAHGQAVTSSCRLLGVVTAVIRKYK